MFSKTAASGALCVVGLALIGVCGYNFYRLLQFRQLPVATGRVVHSDATQTQMGPEDYLYKIDIAVEFEVGGKRYTATSIGPDSAISTSDRGWVDKILTRLQPPVQVPVRYREGNPADAIIDAGEQPGFWVLGIWGLCALFAGVWIKFAGAWMKTHA